MIRYFILTITFCTVLSSSLNAEEKYANPDAPEVHAAAVQALKNAQILPLSGKVLEIKGVTRGVSGMIEELGGKVTDREVRLELSADVLFDFNKAEIKPAAVETLSKVAQVIKNYGNAPVMIEGHTDSVGADDYNLTLSESRAQSVKTWMQKQGGIGAARMSIKGWGESKPAAANTKPDGKDDPEGRQKNRRVEITIRTK
ncbi:OmpA family protein [bacterium]|nr:OmpA family protein [bacterium]MCI0617167.1 OmpA family protein [bacterium]